MLSILDVSKLSEGYSRPIVEGEAYYASGLLFGVGLLEKKGTVLKCQGLAVQTSATSGKPHEIDVCFDTNLNPGEKILNIKCSCIAGNSEKCKHVVATALWLTRHSEDELEDVSCTDLQQQWGKMKSHGKPDFEGCLLEELCHMKDKKSPPMPEITKEMRDKWRNTLLNCKLPS